jgi:hypothetical protein
MGLTTRSTKSRSLGVTTRSTKSKNIRRESQKHQKHSNMGTRNKSESEEQERIDNGDNRMEAARG